MAITDFEEWLFQVELDDYEDVYALYKAVQEGDEYGMFKCVVTKSGNSWIVNGGGSLDDLLLASEDAHTHFLRTLEKKYCGDYNMEGWYNFKRDMAKD